MQANLMKSDDPTRSYMPTRSANESGRRRLVHQHISANHYIEWFRGRKRLNRLDTESGLLKPAFTGALFCHGNGIGGLIDANHGSGPSHHLGRKQGNATGPATKIENPHAFLKARLAKQTLSDRPKDHPILQNQALQLTGRTTEHISFG
jgi:hypothetical protein